MIQNIDYIDKNRITLGIVANANNDLILKTIMDAESQKLINPVLIGNIDFMTTFIDKHKWSLSKDKLIESYSEEESSKIACEVASRDTSLENNIIIKGHLHTDVLMGEYIKKEYNLRIRGKRLSHIWFMTFPNDTRQPIIITDGALNISPSLETKKYILSNVLEYTKKIPSFNPYVAVLSATEEQLKQMPSSIEAHDLVEWAKINYSDTPVEGPFALDNAISQESAKIKGTLGIVPGNANVIIVPNIETGNALVKSLVHFANATAGGFVIGGKSPVVITSRSDDEKSRMASIINAVICTY
jgi:phosphate acetyltransferase